MIKSTRERFSGNVARTEIIKNVFKLLVAKDQGINHLENLGIDGRILLK
jgi:hypothetical protein